MRQRRPDAEPDGFGSRLADAVMRRTGLTAALLANSRGEGFTVDDLVAAGFRLEEDTPPATTKDHGEPDCVAVVRVPEGAKIRANKATLRETATVRDRAGNQVGVISYEGMRPMGLLTSIAVPGRWVKRVDGRRGGD